MSVQVSYKKQFLLGIMFLLVIIMIVEGIARTIETHFPQCAFLDEEAFNQGAERLQRNGLPVVNGIDVRSHRPALGLELRDRTALLLRLAGQGLHHASLPRIGGADHLTS